MKYLTTLCGTQIPVSDKEYADHMGMPWEGDISHTQLSDGRVVLRGSPEEAEHNYGIRSFAPYNAPQRMCDSCSRPRDNYHPTMCPICLRYGTKQGPPLPQCKD